MSEASEETPADPIRQLRQHLDSLRIAGVHWLPAHAPVPAENTPAVQSSLFAAANAPSPSGDGEQRRRELTVLAERVAACQRCAELVVSR
ncbi:MAG TPA: hypothetical protein VH575_10055 [Gemmataceae bacterium]